MELRDYFLLRNKSPLLPALVIAAALVLWSLHQIREKKKQLRWCGEERIAAPSPSFLPQIHQKNGEINNCSEDIPLASLMFMLSVSTNSTRLVIQPFMPLSSPHFRQSMFQLPIQFSIKTIILRRIVLCSLLDIMGCQVCSLLWRKWWLAVQMGALCSILFIILWRIGKTQSFPFYVGRKLSSGYFFPVCMPHITLQL